VDSHHPQRTSTRITSFLSGTQHIPTSPQLSTSLSYSKNSKTKRTQTRTNLHPLFQASNIAPNEHQHNQPPPTASHNRPPNVDPPPPSHQHLPPPQERKPLRTTIPTPPPSTWLPHIKSPHSPLHQYPRCLKSPSSQNHADLLPKNKARVTHQLA